MWDSATDEEDLHDLSLHVFKPLELLVNYTLLQYLVMFYWTRRRERRVILLFVIGSLGVMCLVPFANEDESLVSHLNDVSEACCTITFLLQITIVGYDLNKKIKFKSILRLTYVAESLILVNIAFAVVSAVATIQEDLVGDVVGVQLPNVIENVTMVFIFGFRVYCIAAATSWRELYTTRRVEFFCYFLFMIHEVPFVVLDEVTGLSWEALQSLFNRVTIALCLVATVNSKLRATGSATSRRTSGLRIESAPRMTSMPSMLMKRSSNQGVVYVTTEVQQPQALQERIDEQPRTFIPSQSTVVDQDSHIQ